MSRETIPVRPCGGTGVHEGWRRRFRLARDLSHWVCGICGSRAGAS